MPARDAASPSFVIPRRFDPRWSLLGCALRRWTGDRLRAEALQIVGLTAAALVWLMGAYAFETLTAVLAPGPLALALGAAGLALAGAGLAGVRPRAVVTAGAAAVRVERGRERVRWPYASLASAEVVGATRFHRRYRRCAAVRPFLGAPLTGVLLLRRQGGGAVALGLAETDRSALHQIVAAHAFAADGEQAPQAVAG